MSMERTSLMIPPELREQMTPAVLAFVESLLQTIAVQQREIDELRTRVNRTPQNSSQPPSSVHLHAKPAPPPSSGKKRGGQPGHPKHERALVPPEEVTETFILKPQSCRGCGKRLSGEDPDPLRHQVFELPEIKPVIMEYQRHRLTCACCGVQTCAVLPRGVPEGQTGPRLTAFTGLLMGCFRQSKSRAKLFLEQWLGQPCSTGLTVKLQNLTTRALQPVYQQLCAALPAQPVLNIDETPTKEATAKSWLWTFVARGFTVFAVRPTRGAVVLDELLTEKFSGVVGCDRAKMYWQEERLQWCWAHLKRDFQAMADSPHRQARGIGEELLAQTKLLFRRWHRFAAAAITRTGLKQTLAPVRRDVERLLRKGFVCGHGPTEGTCTELLHHREWLWTFLDHDGVQPTNNASERALRHGVIWRKLSFGTQSSSGSRFVETLLSIIETCRQQGRNVWEFVTEAVRRMFHRRRSKTLLSTA